MSRKPDPMSVKFILLGLIQQHPIHPYDLYKRLGSDTELKDFWKFNQSQLYAMLDKIEKKRLIVANIEQGSIYPSRKVYSITDEGVHAFEKWKYTPVEHINLVRSDFMGKLYFLENDPIPVFEQTLKSQIDVFEESVVHLHEQLEKCGDPTPYYQSLISYRIMLSQATISWLKRCIEEKKKNE